MTAALDTIVSASLVLWLAALVIAVRLPAWPRPMLAARVERYLRAVLAVGLVAVLAVGIAAPDTSLLSLLLPSASLGCLIVGTVAGVFRDVAAGTRPDSEGTGTRGRLKAPTDPNPGA